MIPQRQEPPKARACTVQSPCAQWSPTACRPAPPRVAARFPAMRFPPAMSCHWRAHALAVAFAGALAVGETAVGAPAPRAAKAPEELINWYYSAAFGTGF